MRIVHPLGEQRPVWPRFLVAAVLLLTVLPVTATSASDSPYNGTVAGSGKGLTIGYISLGDSVPFVKLVSDNIKAQAQIAGAKLIECDSQLDAAKALNCAKSFKTQKVQGILNFQLDEKAAPAICAAGPQVPVISIDIHQKPCEIAFMGANNHYAGYVAGQTLGAFAKSKFGCKYDAFVTLESPTAGAVNEARIGGYLDGFKAVCGPLKNLRRLGVGGTIDLGRQKFSDELTALTSAKTILVGSLNDDMLLGAFAAARSQGRMNSVWGSAQGADPTSWKEIKTDPHWVGDTAYFPERYGTITIPAIIDAIKGKKVPPTLFTHHVVLTAKNIDRYYKVK